MQKGKIELKFNTSVYKKRAIQEAISAYSTLAEFSTSRAKRYTKVKINKVSFDVGGSIADEFANYVLGLTKRCL